MAPADVDPQTRVEGYKRAFQRPLGFPVRLGMLFSLVLVFLACAFMARAGSDLARALAGVSFLVCMVGLMVGRRWFRKKWTQPRIALYRSLRRLDEPLAARAARVYGTYDRLRQTAGEPHREGSTPKGESLELAELQVSRIFEGVSLEAVQQSGRGLRRRLLLVALGLGAACTMLLISRALVIVEGVDVLFARNGEGPFPIAYVSQMSVTSELPSYLDGAGRKRLVRSRLAMVPQGSEMEVRIVPRVRDRKLILTDGFKEVPLVSDGQGGLVGRWSADQPSMLRVAVRFGDVLLFDGNETLLSPLEDRPPQVLLTGAPRRQKLAEMKELVLEYLATDDYGLSQVDLVIQSGQRTHREELSHLDGQRKAVRGAHRLTPDHEMFRRAFLPVHVSVEARDGNTATGPGWGRSQAITLIPEPLGKEMADRHRSLRAFRDALTAYLAEDIQAAHESLFDAKQKRTAARQTLLEGYDLLQADLAGATNVPEHTLAFLKAQVEALSREGAEKSTAESVLLATDALIQMVSQKEAYKLAQDLGAAVEEIAVQARELRLQTEGVREEGLEDLVVGAKEGARQLREVGTLGLDLGSVAEGDLARIERTLKKKEYDRAEAAAVHLAERLKRATPSFGSKGGAVESGQPTASGAGEDSNAPPSQAPSSFDEVSKAVDDLAQEAAAELSELERMLRDAQRAAQADFESTPDLSQATQALREAMRGLPPSSVGPVGARAEAAAARGHGEAMADALEAGDLKEAVERGLDSDQALRRAEELLDSGQAWLDRDAVEKARKALDEALSEAKKAAEQLQKKASDTMGDSLTERAKKQREFSDRARELGKRGSDPSAPLPRESLEALKRASELLEKAAQAMEAGRGQEGAEHAADAQSELERALPQSDASEQGEEGTEGLEDSAVPPPDGSVPEEERNRAKDFRERVEKGLGRGGGRLSPAVRRYAEELK